MNEKSTEVSEEIVKAFLKSLFEKGVRLWLHESRLCYSVQKGALTPDDIEALKRYRSEVFTLLDKARSVTNADLQPHRRPFLDEAPATFSQVAHWNHYQLRTRGSVRQVAVAIRLTGTLSPEELEKSATKLIKRHEALRTNLVEISGDLRQQISQTAEFVLDLEDLSGLSKIEQDFEVTRQISDFVAQAINPARDRLFAMRLLRIQENIHVLIVAMDHLISDGVSLGILVRELFGIYAHGLRNEPYQLPPVPVQLGDYAAWQRNTHKSWREQHDSYWSKRLAGSRAARFRADRNNSEIGWGRVVLRIEAPLKTRLQRWSKERGATLAMSVFTGYVVAVLSWCEATDAVFQFQIDGRVSPQLQSTIGYIASALCLRVTVLEGDSFVDLLKKVIDEYCSAHSHADSSYFAAGNLQPEITKATLFNWVPRVADSVSPVLADTQGLAASVIEFEHPMFKTMDSNDEPALVLSDEGETILVECLFSNRRHSAGLMRQFTELFINYVTEMTERPDKSIGSGVFPSLRERSRGNLAGASHDATPEPARAYERTQRINVRTAKEQRR